MQHHWLSSFLQC